jgi:hypothetical protein
MKYSTMVLAILVVLGLGLDTQASILLDRSPAVYGLGTPSYSNQIAGPHFAERIVFDSAVEVAGMDVYSSPSTLGVGDLVTITLWADASGLPGTMLQQFTATLSAIDTDGAAGAAVRKHADFSAISLAASTSYWMGMSGTSKELGQGGLASIPAGADGKMAYWNGGFYGLVGTGDMAFRLYSEDAPAVPEPATLAIWSWFGAVGAGIGWRRKPRRRS